MTDYEPSANERDEADLERSARERDEADFFLRGQSEEERMISAQILIELDRQEEEDAAVGDRRRGGAAPGLTGPEPPRRPTSPCG
ncbi:hypothetical protein [Tsukamurella sp. PLM1]|uniref:hypothetical protein n=1 Tax=Tsukamurella sp. PLM1 TaxID=2929795 RepID=UPI00205A6709|nr:hypothetical protein [Tsukamurella sp. PLM1]BDH58659.1 hypothetical protein MTP03_35980 [Tsukamurella sp. PLM1]